ncbi:MAG: NAD-dependent epimerase/dehydratase family protein [Chloroflexota bacterium]
MEQGTYLVAGAAGFIGSKVCEQLLTGRCAVVGVDNLNDAYDVRLKLWRLAELERQEGFEFHALDICDRAGLRRLFLAKPKPFRAVLNLAARAGVRASVENPWLYVETNVTGTLNLLDLCRETGVGKFILASTSSLYGERCQRPFKEDAVTDAPISPYAATKKAAEALCYAYHHLHGLDVTVLRYFTVYGPAGRPDMSPFRFVQWITEGRTVTVYGDGTQQRDFTYVEDIARGTVAAVLRMAGYDVINLGSDRPVTLNEVIGLIERLVGRKARVEYRPRHRADVLATWAHIAKAERVLGWRPDVTLEKGMGETVRWYQDNRSWASQVRTE